MDKIYVLMAGGECWEDMVIYLTETQAIDASKKFPNWPVRTAPVKGAARYPCTPHGNGHQEIVALVSPCTLWSTFVKTKIEDPFCIVLYQILTSFVLLKTIKKSSRSGYH